MRADSRGAGGAFGTAIRGTAPRCATTTRASTSHSRKPIAASVCQTRTDVGRGDRRRDRDGDGAATCRRLASAALPASRAAAPFVGLAPAAGSTFSVCAGSSAVSHAIVRGVPPATLTPGIVSVPGFVGTNANLRTRSP